MPRLAGRAARPLLVAGALVLARRLAGRRRSQRAERELWHEAGARADLR